MSGKKPRVSSTDARNGGSVRMRRSIAAGFALASATSACGSSGGEPTSATPDVLVTDDAAVSRTHEASFLMIDEDDADTVYLSESELQTGDCRLYVSTNQGGTWSAVEETVDSLVETEKDPGAEQSPEVAPHTDCTLGSGSQNIRTELDQAPDGTLYYLFAGNHSNPAVLSRTVLLGRSDDGGSSWETTIIDDGTRSAPTEVEVNFQAHMAIDPDNPELIYAMWRRSQGGQQPRPPTRPFMAISEDGGTTFGEPFEMLEVNPGFDGPRPVVVDGELFAFYRESAPQTEDDAPPEQTKLFVSRSADRGQTWDEPTLLASALDASEPIPLYDRDAGTFHVVYHDNRNGDLDVFHTSSPDGSAWSEAMRLNDDLAENNIGQFYPQISQSPSGRLDVAWYDFRNDLNPPPGGDYRTHGDDVVVEPGEPLDLSSNMGVFQSVFTTSSTDGGATWSENVEVNDTLIDRSIGTWNNDYFVVVPVSVASWDDRMLVSWSDTRNGTSVSGTQDIYTSALAVADEGTSPLAQVITILGAALLGAGLALLAAVAFIRRSRSQGQTASSA